MPGRCAGSSPSRKPFQTQGSWTLQLGPGIVEGRVYPFLGQSLVGGGETNPGQEVLGSQQPEQSSFGQTLNKWKASNGNGPFVAVQTVNGSQESLDCGVYLQDRVEMLVMPTAYLLR